MTQTAKPAATLLRPGLHHQTEGEEDRLGGVVMKISDPHETKGSTHTTRVWAWWTHYLYTKGLSPRIIVYLIACKESCKQAVFWPDKEKYQ